MTVTTTTTNTTYSGDGFSTVFPTVFEFQLPTDITVQTVIVATGIVTTLVLGVDYTVSGGGSPAQDGSVTLTLALPVGTNVALVRTTPVTQLTHWTPNDPNPSTAIENAVDKLTMILQQGIYGSARTWYLRPFDTDGSGAFDARGNRGTNIANPIGSTDVVPLGFMQTYIASLISTGFAGAPQEWNLVGNGTQVTFPIPLATVPFATGYYVFQAGLELVPTVGYTVNVATSPATITFTTAPGNNVKVNVRSFGFAIPVASGIDASAITSGIMNPLRLGSGTPSNHNWLRGDNVWSNALIGLNGDFVTPLPTDVQTVIEARNNGASAIKISSGAGSVGSLRFATAGSGQAWDTQIAYNPNIGAWGWQIFGGPMLGIWTDIGDMFIGTNTLSVIRSTSRVGINNPTPLFDLDVTGNVNVTGNITGHASGSLINAGQVLPQFLASNAPSSSLYLRGDGVWAIPPGGGGGGGPTTIQVSDATIPSTTMNTLHLLYDHAAYVASGVPIGLSIRGISGGIATIEAFFPPSSQIGFVNMPDIAGLSVIGNATNGIAGQTPITGTTNQVLRVNSSGTGLGFGLLNSGNIASGSLTPSLLNSTNSPSNTYVPSYDSGTGNFTWVAQGGGSGGLPPGGTQGQFLRGDLVWSNAIFNSFPNGFDVNDIPSGVTLRMYGNFDGAHVRSANFGTSTNYPTIYTGQLAVEPAIGSSFLYSIGDANDLIISNRNIKALRFKSDGAGYERIYNNVSFGGPGSGAITLDANLYQYFSITVSGNINFTFTDTGTDPGNGTTITYATDFMVELISPGVSTITWPASVTWLAGSAPTLNTSGSNLIKFVRRIGTAGYLGWPVTAAGSYTDAQARAAVGSNVINTATVHLTYSAGPQTIAASIPNGGINASALFANGVVPVSAISASGSPGSGNYLRGDGTWAVPAGGGGGGQAAIQFGNQGIGIGSAGAITGVNFAGPGVTASAVGTQVTVSIPGAPNGTNNVFNVAQAPYNADKTGAVSCNTAVSAAYAAAVAAGGGTVYFPAGTYLVTSTLTFNSNVNILGDGCSTISAGYNSFADAPTSAATVLRWGGAPGGRLMRFPTAINGIKVGGFHLISPTVNQCGTGIEINSASNCRFSDISGVSFGQYGFRMNATGTSGSDAIQMCTIENLSFQMYNDGMALQGIPIWLGAQNSSAGLSDVTRCVFINCNVTHQNIGFYIGFADGNVFIGCGSNHVYAPTFRTDAYDNNYDFVLDSQDSIGGFSGPNIFYHPLGTFRALASSRPGYGPKAYIVGTQCGGDLVFPPKVDGNLASNSWINWQFFNFDYQNGAPVNYGFRFPQMSFGTAITYGLGVPASDGQMPGLLMYSGEQPHGSTDSGEFRFHGASLGTTPQSPKRLLSTAVG